MRKLTTAELVARKLPPEEFLRLPRHPLSVVCHNIRSLQNVGLIFRLCDAVRAERLYLCGFTGYPPMPEGDPRPPWVRERAGRVIAKTAVRSVDYVPWSHRERALDVIAEQRAAGAQIVALEQTDVSRSYVGAPYRFPVCVVLGHEREGVSSEVLEQADLVVDIPMCGLGNSLNVAMAFGIVAYELLRCCLRADCGRART